MIRTVAALLVLAAACLGSADESWELRLPGLLVQPKGGEARELILRLALRGGAVVAAAGEAPSFNRMVYAVDAAGLKLEGGATLQGRVVVTVPSDGYVPAPGTSITANLDIEATRAGASRIAGSFRGDVGGRAVQGELQGAGTASPGASALSLTLQCESALWFADTKPGKGERTTICLGIAADGTVHAVRVVPRGSVTDTGYGARADAWDLSLRDGLLRGTIDVAVNHQDGRSSRVRVALDGRAYGDAVLGSSGCAIDGRQLGAGCFRGTLVDGARPPLDDAHAEIVLHDAIGLGKYARVFLARRGGAWSAAFATLPNYNNATHDVALGDLAIVDGRLRGSFAMTVNCDPWIPKDRKVRTVPVSVDLAFADAELRGTFAATYDGKEIAGPADGFVTRPRRVGESFKTTVKMEEAVGGENAWVGRVFVSGRIEQGRWVEGRPWNNHNAKMTGAVREGTLSFADDRIRGEWTLSLDHGGGIQAGSYRVSIDGPAVGELAAGVFRIRAADGTGPERTGRFWASADAK